eukprot:2921555-Prymnesium_polylepis.1
MRGMSSLPAKGKEKCFTAQVCDGVNEEGSAAKRNCLKAVQPNLERGVHSVHPEIPSDVLLRSVQLYPRNRHVRWRARNSYGMNIRSRKRIASAVPPTE